MLSKKTVLTSTLALAISANVVAEEVPVIDLGGGTVPSQVTNAPQQVYTASKNSELMMIVLQLQDEVRALRGQIEQQDHRIKQMERQQLDRYRDLDRRISSVQQSGVAPSTVATTSSVSASAAQPSSGFQPPKPEMVQPDAAPSDAKAYREAFGLVRERNYPKAIEAFTNFIKDYPQSARLANAHYWLGEIYLAEQKPELARESFVQVITNFADHRKAPDAAYKLGIVYDQLGDKAKSVEYLDMVINKYPDSSAVRLAKEFKRLQ